MLPMLLPVAHSSAAKKNDDILAEYCWSEKKNIYTEKEI